MSERKYVPNSTTDAARRYVLNKQAQRPYCESLIHCIELTLTCIRFAITANRTENK